MKEDLSRERQSESRRRKVFRFAALPGLLCCVSCRQEKPIIYVIPRTTATLFWESVHNGAQLAGQQCGYRIYWNAATRDDDVGRQIALLERAGKRRPAGLIVAPVHAVALLTVVRRLVDGHMPVVIIGSRLPLPPGPDLMYLVPDHRKAGQGIAAEILELEPKPRVALIGVNPDVTANTEVVDGLREGLQAHSAARVTAIRFSRFNRQEAGEQLESLLKGGLEVNTVVALDAATTAGTLDALHRLGLERRVHVIGRDQDFALENLLLSGEISALLEEDTYAEGFLAVQAIAAHRRTGSWPAPSVIHTRLLTATNIHDPAMRQSFTTSAEH